VRQAAVADEVAEIDVGDQPELGVDDAAQVRMTPIWVISAGLGRVFRAGSLRISRIWRGLRRKP
jgi:hypothetical protein